jgi:hypothetical protein
MSYQTFAPKPKTSPVWWVLGGVSALIAAILVTWIVSANVNEAAKINKMVSMADSIPAGDWELTRSARPTHDITCIPFDQSCHTLFRTWRAAEPVYVGELAAATGYDLEVGTVYRPDCADGWADRVSIRLCADGTDIELTMRD